MSQPQEQETNGERGDDLLELLHDGRIDEVRDRLIELHPAETAHLLQSLPPEERQGVWELAPPEEIGDILIELNEDVRRGLLRDMDHQRLVDAVEDLETDDLVDLLQEFPDIVTERILLTLEKQNRDRVEAVLSYPEDSAAGLMNIDTVTVRPDITLDVAQRYLRRIGSLPETTDNLIVVDRNGIFQGLIRLSDILTRQLDLKVGEVMSREVEAIPAGMPVREVARLFEQRDLVSAPVVDEDGKVLGRITIDDVVDVIREEAEHSVMSMAGLSEEDDMFAPVVTSSRRRTLWLGINLLTALLASWVIGLFDATIERLVALAVLMPIVASMGGIAGTQTLTLVIRGIALGVISGNNARRLLLKELAVGALNGLIWALVVGGVAATWFDDEFLGLIIAVAILVNLIVAALAGATIPLLLRRLGIDPALAGGVLLTTVTDVIGFLAFLGMATAFLI